MIRICTTNLINLCFKDQRIDILYQASKYVIQNKIPEDSWLGIVWFESAAVLKKKLTKVVSQQIRNSLVDALPKKATGGTCIGCGIEMALQVFFYLFRIHQLYIYIN